MILDSPSEPVPGGNASVECCLDLRRSLFHRLFDHLALVRQRRENDRAAWAGEETARPALESRLGTRGRHDAVQVRAEDTTTEDCQTIGDVADGMVRDRLASLLLISDIRNSSRRHYGLTLTYFHSLAPGGRT